MMFEQWIKNVAAITHKIMGNLSLLKSPSKESSLYWIHDASKKGDLRSLKLLLSQENPSFDVPDDRGSTPIFYALEYNHRPVVDFLMKQKINLNHANIFGRTPIFAAVDSDNPELIDLIARNGGNLTILDGNNQSIIHHAILEQKEKALAFILEEENAPLNEVDKFGKTALIVAAELGLIKSCKALLSKGALIDSSDYDGWTALMYAANKGSNDLLSLLIASEANIQIKDKQFQQTAYLIACRGGYTETAEILLRNGANPKDIDYYQRTALHIAVETNNSDTVRFVLSTHVDVLAKDKFNLTAREWAIVNSTAEVLRLIMEAEKKALQGAQ
jgi:ankyrin repeat protein